MEWTPIRSAEQIEEIIKESYQNPVAIFKHSTSCSVSFIAKMRLEDKFQDISKDTKFYFLDLIAYRQISDLIEEIFSVHHESPQLILLKDGQAEYDASHFDISIEELNETLAYHYG